MRVSLGGEFSGWGDKVAFCCFGEVFCWDKSYCCEKKSNCWEGGEEEVGGDAEGGDGDSEGVKMMGTEEEVAT